MAGRRWSARAAGAAVSVLVASGLVVSSRPADALTGADLVTACAPATAVPEVGPRACKSVQTGTWLSAQACRRVDPLKDPVCPTVDGRRVSEAAMVEFEGSWLARALALQAGLDLHVPFSQALLPHTHNSANSSAYAPSVSTLDANQVLTITDQLRLGMRAIEIDIHWAPQLGGDSANGFRAVVQCHGEPVVTPAGTIHAGCIIDTPLGDLLHELRAWLDAHPDEFVLLYLENVLDGDPTGHAEAVSAINDALGDLVARPTVDTDDTCESLPVARTKQDILDDNSGQAQVLITGNCGPSGWDDWVFERGSQWDESGGSDFDCAATRTALSDFDSIVVRRYEDSTWLSAMVGSGSHRNAATIGAMVHCGVNLVGFDQLYPADDRLPALVWSWRTNEPSVDATGQCAAQGSDGHFFAGDCSTSRRVACRADAGWAITDAGVPWAERDNACQADGHDRAGVPANGWDNGRLRAVADSAGIGDVWIAYGQDGGTWTTWE